MGKSKWPRLHHVANLWRCGRCGLGDAGKVALRCQTRGVHVFDGRHSKSPCSPRCAKDNQHLHHFASFCIILHHFASFEKDLLCLAQCLAQCLAAFGCAFSLHPSTGDPESALAFIQGLYPHTHATGRPCFKQNHISIVIFKIYLRMYFRNLPDVIEDA